MEIGRIGAELQTMYNNQTLKKQEGKKRTKEVKQAKQVEQPKQVKQPKQAKGLTKETIEGLKTGTKTADKSVYTKAERRQVYLDKALAMKEESELKMMELFEITTQKTFNKQNGGLRGVLQRLLDGQNKEAALTEKDITKAKESLAPGGYWSAESTSDRFIDFAKALSQDNPEKADALIEGFKKGYKAAEQMWGGELPKVSQQTYDLTLEKFEQWKKGTLDKPTEEE